MFEAGTGRCRSRQGCRSDTRDRRRGRGRGAAPCPADSVSHSLRGVSGLPDRYRGSFGSGSPGAPTAGDGPPGPADAAVLCKRNRTDAADAEAICEAVTRPSIRFVPVKGGADSAALVRHRARDVLVGRVAQVGNAIRAHMAGSGIIAAKGSKRVATLAEELHALPGAARLPLQVPFDQLAVTQARIDRLAGGTEEVHRRNEVSRRPAVPRARRAGSAPLA